MNDEERDRLEYESFYAEENAKKVIAGFVLVAIVLGLVVGTADWLLGYPVWLDWIRP